MTAMMSIVVASPNAARRGEVRALLGDLPVEVLTASEALGDDLNLAHDGDTFADNALKKARAVAEAAMMVTIADDSGLEVEALGGRPGVRSARFAREGATDAENNAELLRRLEDIDDEQRVARFRTVIALVDPWASSDPIVLEGTCEGRIARSPSGTGGFGYEPLFIVAGLDRTLAEIDAQEKERISHRAKALRQLEPKLAALVEERLAVANSIMRGTYNPPASTR